VAKIVANVEQIRSNPQGQMRIRLFGELEVQLDGFPMALTRTRKERHLLALLALRNGRPIGRERLSRELWPESLPTQSRANLRRSLSNLSKALGPQAGRLRAEDHDLSLDLTGAEVDALEFDEAIAHRTPQSLRQAIALHSAPLLPDCEDEWAVRERTARIEAYFGAVETLALWADPAESISLLRQALAVEPTREPLLRRLMELLAEAGDTSSALEAYRKWFGQVERIGWRPSEETVDMASRLRSRPPSRPGAKSVLLPPFSTRFVGREAEMTRLPAALREVPVVFLTGLPGIGKTRLAAELGRRLAESYADGVCMIDASVPHLVSAIAGALNLEEGQTAESLSSFLRRRNLLLILDDVGSEAKELIAQLATGFSRCRVLALGRNPMEIAGSVKFHLQPLEDEAEILELFEDRARRRNREFRISEENAGLVKRVCSQLDGLPLALEIVAAWTDSLPLEFVEGKLALRLALDDRGERLKAAFDESLALLSEPEATLLGQASLFADGWTLEAAAGVSGLSEIEAAFVHRSLIQRSLITLNQPQARYRMLAVTREIVLDRLSEPERAGTSAKIAAYYREQLLELEKSPDRYFEDLPLPLLLRERNNFESVLGWWERHDPREAARLTFLLYHWRVLPARHIRPWIARMLGGEPLPPSLEPLILVCAGFACLWDSRPEASDLFSAAAERANAAGETRWEAHAYNGLSVYHQSQGRFDLAEQAEAKSESAARRAQMPFFAELALASLGYLRWKLGQAGAVWALQDQLKRGASWDGWRARYAALRPLAAIALEEHDDQAASRYSEELAELARVYCRHELVNVLFWCAKSARALADPKRAKLLLEEALQVSEDRGELDRIARAYEEWAALAEWEGDLNEAERYKLLARRAFEARNAGVSGRTAI